MLRFHPAFYLMDKSGKDEAVNEDHAHYLIHHPAPVRVPLLWRLVPGALRSWLKARQEARAYERSLVHLWQISPHLLDDIGVGLGVGDALDDHLIEVPERVVEKVEAIERSREALMASAAPAPTSAAPVQPEPKVAAGKPSFKPTILAKPRPNRALWAARGSV